MLLMHAISVDFLGGDFFLMVDAIDLFGPFTLQTLWFE